MSSRASPLQHKYHRTMHIAGLLMQLHLWTRDQVCKDTPVVPYVFWNKIIIFLSEGATCHAVVGCTFKIVYVAEYNIHGCYEILE